MMKFSDQLEQMSICDEAIEWVGRRGLMTAWRDCECGDWMLSFADRIGVDHTVVSLAACDCAEPALRYIPSTNAISTVRDWANGKASTQDVKESIIIDYPAYTADVVDATNAVNAVCSYVVEHSVFVNAAYYAAWAAYYAACIRSHSIGYYSADFANFAHTKALKQQSELIRKKIPYKTIKQAMDKHQKQESSDE